MSFVDIENILWFLLEDSLLVNQKQKGGLVAVLSHRSSPTVETENRVKRLKPNVNRPAFRLRFRSSLRFMGFTKCQIKHDRNCISLRSTNTTRWVAHFWKQKFSVATNYIEQDHDRNTGIATHGCSAPMVSTHTAKRRQEDSNEYWADWSVN